MATQEYVFLKFTPDIKGTALTGGNEGQVVVDTISYGVRQTGKYAEKDEAAARVTEFSDIQCSKVYDLGSPGLAKACAAKTKFDSVSIVIKSGDIETLVMTLKKVLVTSVAVNYSAPQDNPHETFTLSFRSVEYKKGTEVGGFDLDTNMPT